MRILLITTLDFWSMGRGAGAPSFYKTVNGLVERGVEIDLITMGKEGIRTTIYSSDGIVGRVNDLLTVHRLRIPRLGLHSLDVHSTLGRRLQRIRHDFLFPAYAAQYGMLLARKDHYDIFYGYESMGASVAFLLAKLVGRGARVVFRFQGVGWACFFPENPLCLESRLKNMNHIAVYRLPADLYIMTNDGTFGDKMLFRLNSTVRRHPERLMFWVNGVDLPEASSTMSGYCDLVRRLKETGKHSIFAASTHTEWKRVDRLLRMFSVLKGMRKDVHLFLAGDGPVHSSLKELARQLGVADSVTFFGAIPNDAVIALTQECDIFVSAYQFSNVGNPLLQALKVGACIVTVNNGGVPEFIQNGVNGFVLDEHHWEINAAETIDRILQDPDLVERIRLCSKRTGQKIWSWDERMDAEYRVLHSLVNGTL